MTFEEIKKSQGPLPAGLKLDNIDDEEHRTIFWPETGANYVIHKPVALFRRREGTTHRVVDANGLAHCYPIAGAVITWKVKTGQPPVRF